MKTLDEYFELAYHITIVHDRDEDGNEGFVAEVEELPGCISQGCTLARSRDRLGPSRSKGV